MKKLLIIFGLFILLVFAGYSFLNNQIEDIKNESMDTLESDLESTDSAEMPLAGEEIVYTLEDVAEHDNKNDCWIIINGNVYDVTAYIKDKSHPGGEALLEGCGIDATELYETRPMGSNTPHSEKARGFLDSFQIGVSLEEPEM